MPRLVFVTDQAIDRIFPRARSSILENPGSPSRGFLLRFMRRQPRGRRRPSGRPADRPRHGRRASRQLRSASSFTLVPIGSSGRCAG